MIYHEHPLRILKYSLKNIWLLIFPLLRGVSVLSFNPKGIYAWIKGAWFDIAVIGIILVYGFIRWYFSQITLTDNAITHKNGFIFRIQRTIPFESVSSAATETLFFLIPFKAVGIRCDTRAGFFKSTDLKLLVTQKTADIIMNHIPDVKIEKAIKGIPEPTLTSVALFSVFFSSGFSGAVYIAAFFFKGGDIAKDIINFAMKRITMQAEQIYPKFLGEIPKAAVIAGVFFIAAWFLSFVLNLLMYAYFKISADNDCINVSFGLIKRRRHRIKTEHINYVDLRQNLIMKICRAVAVNISCAGFGYKSHLPVLLPISSEQNLDSRSEILGIKNAGVMKYRPKPTAFFSYTGIPLLCIILIAVLHHFSDYLYFPDFLPEITEEIFLFLAVMAYIPLVWLVMVKIAALFTSGITLYPDSIVLRCARGTRFHTVIAKRENVIMVQINQNPVQKLFKKCTVVLWLCGESRSRYKVKGLKLSEGREILSELC